jgi:photoactive yellow protein
MKLLELPAFDAPDAATLQAGLAAADLDLLPYGVIEMDRSMQVLRYSGTESRYSGLSPARVVGRHFFREVALCADNRHVAHRYDEASLDQTLTYTFSLRMRPTPVTLRMLKPEHGQRMYLLVRWK